MKHYLKQAIHGYLDEDHRRFLAPLTYRPHQNFEAVEDYLDEAQTPQEHIQALLESFSYWAPKPSSDIPTIIASTTGIVEKALSAATSHESISSEETSEYRRQISRTKQFASRHNRLPTNNRMPFERFMPPGFNPDSIEEDLREITTSIGTVLRSKNTTIDVESDLHGTVGGVTLEKARSLVAQLPISYATLFNANLCRAVLTSRTFVDCLENSSLTVFNRPDGMTLESVEGIYRMGNAYVFHADTAPIWYILHEIGHAIDDRLYHIKSLIYPCVYRWNREPEGIIYGAYQRSGDDDFKKLYAACIEVMPPHYRYYYEERMGMFAYAFAEYYNFHDPAKRANLKASFPGLYAFIENLEGEVAWYLKEALRLDKILRTERLT